MTAVQRRVPLGHRSDRVAERSWEGQIPFPVRAIDSVRPSVARPWIGMLRPGRGSALDHAATDARLVEAVTARVGTDAAGWAVERGQRLREALVGEAFLSGGSASAAARFTEAVAFSMVLGRAGAAEVGGLLANELGGLVRERVPDGVPVDVGLSCVRSVQAYFSGVFFDLCRERFTLEQQPVTMRAVSEELFGCANHLAEVLVDEFTTERDRWNAGSAGERTELVNAILAGEPVDLRRAADRLGYDLTLHHLALLVWRDEPQAESMRELKEVATRVLDRAGCSSKLLLPVGSGRLWAWGGKASGDPTELRRLAGAVSLPSGTHVASGLPGQGPDGFRHSFRQATTAAKTGATARPLPGNLHDYGELELVVLLGQDLGAAAEFVTRELGALAVDDQPTAVLRDTVRCFLDQDRGLAAAAQQLHVARNTVIYRVKKAERLLGRSLHDERLRLHLALCLADRLGSAVLCAGPGDGESGRRRRICGAA
jgi:hypothetical protein